MSSRTKKRLKAARKEAAAALGQSYISRNDPIQLTGGTITLNPPETTETP